MKMTERDLLGYGGLVLVGISGWSLWGLGAAIGVVGCLIMGLGLERR